MLKLFNRNNITVVVDLKADHRHTQVHSMERIYGWIRLLLTRTDHQKPSVSLMCGWFDRVLLLIWMYSIRKWRSGKRHFFESQSEHILFHDISFTHAAEFSLGSITHFYITLQVDSCLITSRLSKGWGFSSSLSHWCFTTTRLFLFYCWNSTFSHFYIKKHQQRAGCHFLKCSLLVTGRSWALIPGMLKSQWWTMSQDHALNDD